MVVFILKDGFLYPLILPSSLHLSCHIILSDPIHIKTTACIQSIGGLSDILPRYKCRLKHSTIIQDWQLEVSRAKLSLSPLSYLMPCLLPTNKILRRSQAIKRHPSQLPPLLTMILRISRCTVLATIAPSILLIAPTGLHFYLLLWKLQ